MDYIGIPLEGMVNVTGEMDSGKTWFCLNSGAGPERTVFFDHDIKTKSLVKEIVKLDHKLAYHDLLALARGKKELEFHHAVRKILDGIRPGQYDVLIWDTFTQFERTFHPLVLKDPLKYKEQYSPNGQIKGGEQWQVANELESQFINELLDKFPLVFLTCHVKSDHQVRTKLIPDIRDPVAKKARFRVWLRSNPRGIPQPVGLVLKRLSVPKVTEMGIEPVNVLPRKLDPCTWERIREFMREPVGDRELLAEEMPDEFEMSILTGALTQTDRDALRVRRLELEKEAGMMPDPLEEFDSDLIEKVRGMKDEGLPPPVMASQLGVEVGKVLRMLSVAGR